MKSVSQTKSPRNVVQSYKVWDVLTKCLGVFHEARTHYMYSVYSFLFVLTSVSDVIVVFFNSETNTTDEAASSLWDANGRFFYFSNRRRQQMFLSRVLNTQQPVAPT